MARKLTKKQKTYLTISGIMLAMGAFIGLLMCMALLFYFLEAVFLK